MTNEELKTQLRKQTEAIELAVKDHVNKRN